MQRVHDVMSHHLSAACNPAAPLQPQNPKALLGCCGALRVLQALEGPAPDYVQVSTMQQGFLHFLQSGQLGVAHFMGSVA